MCFSHSGENTVSQGAELTKSSATRRAVLGSMLISSVLFAATPAVANEDCGLEEISLGRGSWIKATESQAGPIQDPNVPATFSTYACRFLLNFDEGAASWWQGVVKSNSLLTEERQRSNLGRSFARLSRSVQKAIGQFLRRSANANQGYVELCELFLEKYGSSEETRRHIGLLFAILPESLQPVKIMSSVSFKTLSTSSVDQGIMESEVAVDLPEEVTNPPPLAMMNDLTALLPEEFECVRVRGTSSYTIFPPISLFEIGIDEEFGQTATATAAGPLATLPLQRELPDFSFDIYALFGISGAAGCALTHTVVIPLDVVKTRMQTDPLATGSLVESASNIVDREGISGLLLGAQATIAGYMWYGLSVYPSYTFFKRWIGQSLLTPDLTAIHSNDVALVAGALAAVVASLGLTPLEAARIRAVAEPDLYKPKGLLGTLDYIAQEDEFAGWRTLYAGLPSLLTRQVIFGSVKFLAFERACEFIFKLWPILHDATWTSLMVSLVAGGFAGALSSVVSQPADSVLTYVAQSNIGNVGVLQGSVMMVEKEGISSLFRGLGSRCVWAGSIIAGQFLLYDIFRTYFGVSVEDLSQVFQVVIPAGPGAS